MANNIKYESELFQTALKYKEILIYVYKHTKIYKFNYDDKSYYFKINTKDNSLAFTKDLCLLYSLLLFFIIFIPFLIIQNIVYAYQQYY